jgi:hypothetical protein
MIAAMLFSTGQQDRQCSAYNSVAHSCNHCCSGNITTLSFCVYFSTTLHCQPYENTECRTTMLVWQIYVTNKIKRTQGFM